MLLNAFPTDLLLAVLVTFTLVGTANTMAILRGRQFFTAKRAFKSKVLRFILYNGAGFCIRGATPTNQNPTFLVTLVAARRTQTVGPSRIIFTPINYGFSRVYPDLIDEITLDISQPIPHDRVNETITFYLHRTHNAVRPNPIPWMLDSVRNGYITYKVTLSGSTLDEIQRRANEIIKVHWSCFNHNTSNLFTYAARISPPPKFPRPTPAGLRTNAAVAAANLLGSSTSTATATVSSNLKNPFRTITSPAVNAVILTQTSRCGVKSSFHSTPGVIYGGHGLLDMDVLWRIEGELNFCFLRRLRRL